MLTLLLVTLVSCPAPACSCVAIPAPAEAVAQAGIVFEGTPVRVRDTLTPRVGYDGKPFTSRQLRFTVLVSRPWKGVMGDTVDVITGTGGGNCGYPFEIGQRYLVFPDDSAGSTILNVSLCSDTKPTAEAEAELRVLRARAAGRS
jgi:hypothetical protein